MLADGTFEKTARYGELLGEAAEQALSRRAKPVKLTPLQVRFQAVDLAVDNKPISLVRDLGVLKRQAYVWNPATAQGGAGSRGSSQRRLTRPHRTGLAAARAT